MGHQIARMSADLAELDRLLSDRPQAPPYPPHHWAQYRNHPQSQHPAAPVPAVAAVTPVSKPRDERWLGKLLAVAGVAVTLVGVVLLLVLAAQAGLLRPEVRVAAGGVLAVALVAAASWLDARPGGRIGAIALAATGIAAAYIDVIAVTTIYDWVSPPGGLVISAAIGGAGLTLARRWDSEHLGVLVVVPLTVLAPVVVGGVTLQLVAFMLALAAASLPVQLGKDWVWLYAARTAAVTVPLLIASVAVHFDDRPDMWLAGASALAAVLAVGGTLILLPRSTNRVAMALLTGAGVLPVWCVGLGVERVVAALMAAALASVLLSIVLIGDRLPGVDHTVGRIWAALSAVSALIAVLVGFDGDVSAPILLGMAVVVALGGRAPARQIAIGFAAVGAAIFLAYASPASLVVAAETNARDAVSTLISSLLLIACVGAIVWSSPRRAPGVWTAAAVAVVYAITMFTVTAGVLIGGAGGGFFAGHMVATICWILLAAALFAHATRVTRAKRSLPIGGGLALVAAATAKLFLFDLGTLDGIFRVAVFIVVGLLLLGMGAGYARILEKQDQHHHRAAL
jgi:uncharacterized membrane protein